jgi:hypothetical protein
MSWHLAKSNRRSVLKGLGGVVLAASSARLSAQETTIGAQSHARPADFSYPAGGQMYRTHVAKRPIWPDGAKTVATIAVHTDGPGLELGYGHIPLGGTRGWGYYALRAGIERQLELFDSENIKATFCIPGTTR